MQMRRRYVILAVLGALFAVHALVVTGRIYNYSKNDFHAQQLLGIYQEIELGQDSDAVQEVWEKHRVEGLELRKDTVIIPEDNWIDNWIIFTPPWFGAYNWVLYISFSEGEVISLCIRWLDHGAYKPPWAPNDKGVISG